MAIAKRKKTIGLVSYHLSAKEWAVMVGLLHKAVSTGNATKEKKEWKKMGLDEIPKDMKKLKVIGVSVWYE